MGSTSEVTNLSLQLLFGVSGMVLLTVFVVLFFVIYQRRLHKQQMETQLMEAAYQKELLNAGILAQEAERKRMAIELHDSIGGLLSATKIYVSNVNQGLAIEQFQLFKEKALETLNENIREVRTITNDLLPQSLERLGIVAATRDLTQKLIDLKGMEVDLNANSDQRLEPDREKALFRILQELISNTLKYSDAKLVKIDFHFSTDQLLLHYKDDGQGFDRTAYMARKDRKSFGLLNLESRASFLEGKLTYKTAPGEGVEVDVQVPL